MAPLGFALLALAIVVKVKGDADSRGGLEIRAVQTEASCSSDFNWASNSHGETPCLVAAKVLGACIGGNWDVPSLASTNGGNSHYDNPNATTANVCSCSWSAYNLLSACTACQGVPDSIQNWPPYKLDCGGFLSDTYFPPTIVLPTGALIPQYAAQDPSTWPNQRFDVNSAKTIAAQGKPDLSQPTENTKKKAPVGAIVGGVVGGIVVIALAIGVWIFMIRRQRQRPAHMKQNTSVSMMDERPTHNRNFSDQSTKSNFVGFGYAPLTHSTPNVPFSPTTLHTHNGSIGSLSQLASFTTTPPSQPPRVFASPSPSMQHSSTENIITPFALQPLSPIQETPRKGSNGGVYPVYDSPSARPVVREDSRGIATPSRARVNPPTYNESTSGSPSEAHRRLPSKSSDSNHSFETSPSGGTWISGRPAGTASISGMGEVLSQVDMDMMSNTNGNSGNTVATGQSYKVIPPTGDRKRKPDDVMPDIA